MQNRGSLKHAAVSVLGQNVMNANVKEQVSIEEVVRQKFES